MLSNKFRHIMTKSALLNGAAKAKQPLVQQTRRAFSQGTASNASMLGVGAGILGVTGISYLSYMGRQQRKYASPEMQMHLFSPLVQQRM